MAAENLIVPAPNVVIVPSVPLICPVKSVVPPEVTASRDNGLAEVRAMDAEKVLVPEEFKPPRKRVELLPAFMLIVRVKVVPPSDLDKNNLATLIYFPFAPVFHASLSFQSLSVSFFSSG